MGNEAPADCGGSCTLERPSHDAVANMLSTSLRENHGALYLRSHQPSASCKGPGSILIQCHKTATQVPTSDLSCKARLLCVLLTDQLQMEDSYNPSLGLISLLDGEGNGTPLQYSCLENPMDGGAWWAAVHGVAKTRIRLSDFTFTFHFHALEKEMATHSSVLAWRIPGTGEPHGLPSMGSHRVGHD